MSEYLDKLEAELRENGVVADNYIGTISNNDIDLKIIMEMQQALGVEYSDEQKEILRHRGNSVILACAGSGKALVNGTNVLTFDGYKPIEQLKVGEVVFDHTGNEQVVLGVYPQGKKRVYKVIFNTGDIIKCCSEHIWAVKKVSRNYWEVIDTKTIKEDSGAYIVPHDLDIFDGNYKIICSNAYFDLVRRTVITYVELGKLIQQYEPNNIKLKSIYDRCKSNNNIRSLYDFCLVDCYNIAESEQVKSVLKVACEMFGMSTYYVNNSQYVRYITSVEETNEFEEMTCIKVSGLSELFLTEHCIPTHNTTISTHLIAKRIKSGEIKDASKVLYLTYSKDGATEMRTRMQKVMKQLGYNVNIDVRTFHSFFKKLMEDFSVKKQIISDGKKTILVKEACKENGFTPKDDDLMKLQNLMSYQLNNLLGDKKAFECMYNDIEKLTLEQYTNIRKAVALKKQNLNMIDFDDMQIYIYRWVCAWSKEENQAALDYNKAVLDYCKYYFTDFYVDEAQDISKIQYKILKALITDKSDPNKLTANLTFIGDDDQAIYSWRGSDPSIIQNIGPHFNIKNLVLSTNYRCKNEIVDFATTGVKCNNVRYEKGMNAYEKGGSVKIRIVPDSELNLYSMSKIVLQQIKTWISEGQNADDIAVLCRNNKQLSVLSIMLLNENIFYVGTEEMKATKGLNYSEAKMIIEMCEPTWKHEIINKLFWKFNRFLGNKFWTRLAAFMYEASLSLEDTLWYVSKYYLHIVDLSDKNIKVGFESQKKLENAIRDVGESNSNLIILYSLYLAISKGTREEKLNALIALYKAHMDKMSTTVDNDRIMRTLLGYISDIANQYGFEVMKDKLRITEQFESGTVGVLGDKVTLTTMHSAKGREWKNVIMFACDNVSEPSFSYIRSLRESGNVTTEDIMNYIDEERRLFYVGCTRAKENLILMTSNQPSVFILDSIGLEVKNSDILNYAIQGTYGMDFKEDIQKHIVDRDSKYSINTI